VNGDVQFALPDAGAPDLTFKGEVQVAGLAVLDEVTADPFAAWETLRIAGIDFALQPLKAHAATVTLTGLAANVVRLTDGSLNVVAVFRSGAAASATPPVAESASPKGAPAPATPVPPTGGAVPDLALGEIVIEAGRFSFIDRTLTPPHSIAVADMNGRVRGFTSRSGETGEIDLSAMLDGHSKVHVSGRLNPLAQQPYMDVKLALESYDLTASSPYSARYVAHPIDKGKLSLSTWPTASTGGN
jgi:hypothetical protein